MGAPRGDDDFSADAGEALREADRSDGFAFAGGGGPGGGDDNQFSAAPEDGIGEQLALDFATVRPERAEIFFGEFEFARYGLNGKKSFLHEG
jgi:hypothetical protein